jgi:flagellar hook-associated protein 2
MGSPITFGGFNNIDFTVVLNAIMQQERLPLTALETQKKTLEAQNTAFATYATRLGALESAAETLAKSTSLSRVSATVSDSSAVGISTGSSTITGRYEIGITEIAHPQVLASSSTYDSVDDIVATSGVVSLARFSQPPIEIAITGAMTLKDLAAAINSSPDAPVTATVVQVTPGQYRLVLTGRSSGTENAFTAEFSTPLSGGEGLTFTDTDNDGLSGDSDADSVQTARNATVTINGLTVSSTTNVLSDVVPGVTLTLLKQGATAIVDVTKDSSDALARVQKFADGYNDLLTFVAEQTTVVNGGKAGISRDPIVRGLRDALRATLQDKYGADETRLADVGIGFDRNGKITIDKDRFAAALDSSPAALQELFGGADGNGGAFGAVKKLMAEYTKAGGLVADVRHRLDSQVSKIGDRLDVLEAQLAIRRAALQQEFIAADRAMSQLNAQGSSLNQLANQYQLF